MLIVFTDGTLNSIQSSDKLHCTLRERYLPKTKTLLSHTTLLFELYSKETRNNEFDHERFICFLQICRSIHFRYGLAMHDLPWSRPNSLQQI